MPDGLMWTEVLDPANVRLRFALQMILENVEPEGARHLLCGLLPLPCMHELMIVTCQLAARRK
jgi:hypothetical protein